MPREEIEPHKGDKRYVRRDDQGHFKKEVDEERSLSKDHQQHAKTVAKHGEGDRAATRNDDQAGECHSDRFANALGEAVLECWAQLGQDTQQRPSRLDF